MTHKNGDLMNQRFVIIPQDGATPMPAPPSRFKWLYILAILTCGLLVIFLSVGIPSIYVATISIQMEPALSEPAIEELLSRQMIAGAIERSTKATSFALEKIQQRMSAKKINDKVIEISFKAKDPNIAGNFLNALAALYIEKSLQKNVLARKEVLEKLRAENKVIEGQLKTAKEALENFKAQEDIANFPAQTMEMIQVVTGLESKIGDLESEKAMLLRTYAEKNSAVEIVTEEIADYKNHIKAMEPEIAQLPERERKLFELTHDVVMKRQLFLDNSAEVNILARAVIKSDAHLIHPAIVKKKIEWTKIIIAGSLGAAGGLFLCLSWILFQNRNMHSIRTPQILQKIAKLPVLAAIPYSAMAEQKSKRLGMSNYLIDARDDAALEIKNIEKNIHKIIRGASNNIILFASHIANQGKSFIAGNLSLFAAEGRRTLLIDMDIVKGSLHLNFANLRSPGFSDLILGTATLNQVLANPIDNKLWFIPAGTEALNYNLLQDHEKLRSLMNMLSKSFDLVIVDYPTLGLQINNLKILDFAGSIFLVIRQGDRAMRLKRFLLKYPQKLTEISATLLNEVK